ncbi:MAG: T9SS type A sorting domain-containing protein [Dysgonomonas sp.]
MKKIILALFAFCIAFNAVNAQDGTWHSLTGTGSTYNNHAIYFPALKNTLRGFTTGYILAEKIADNTGAILQTSNGGSTWTSLATTATNTSGTAVSFGALKGAQFTDGYTYMWGANRTFIRASTSIINKWTKLDLPQGDNTEIVAARFKTASSGVVTDGSNIYYTANAGDQWTTSAISGSATGITSIAFAGGNTYFAVAKTGKVLKSTNSGYSWSIINNGQSDVDFTAVIFQDANYGIIAGVDPVDTTKSSIWITFDGGETYTKIQEYTSGAFKEITYSDALYAVSKEGQVIKSTDEGSSWAEIKAKDSNSVNNFTITTQSVMYTVGNNGNIAINSPVLKAAFRTVQLDTSNEYSFYAEPIGYATSFTWTFENANSVKGAIRNMPGVSFYKSGKVKLLVQGQVPGSSTIFKDSIEQDITIDVKFDWSVNNVGQSVLNNSIIFPEGQNLIGYIASATSTYSGKGTIWKTTDGGNTWNNIFSSTEAINVGGFEGMAFPSINVGYACGWGEYKNGKQYKQVWKTTDAGATWTELDLSSLVGYFDVNSVYMTDIHFISETEGAVCSGTRIFVTKDGGATWSVGQVTSNVWEGTTVEFLPTKFCYAGDTTLYAVGNSQIFKSTDSGSTWNIIKGTGSLFTGVNFRDVNHGIAVTDESNVIWLTLDGGVTWSTHTTPVSLIWGAVHFIDDNTIYAGGHLDNMVISTDGGFTWVKDNYPVTEGGVNNIFHTATGVIFSSGTQGFVKRHIPVMNADFDYETDLSILTTTNKSVGFITSYKWEVNGVEKSRERNPVLTFENSGSYEVKLTTSGTDPDTGELVEHSVVKIIEIAFSGIEYSISNKASFSTYPNPVTNKLNCSIVIEKTSDLEIVVSSVTGSIVDKQVLSSVAPGRQTFSLNASNWVHGVYFVQLFINGKLSHSTKVIR